MALCTATLVVALVLLIIALGRQWAQRAAYGPCFFVWGVLFTILFVAFPLVLHLTSMPARSVTGRLLTGDDLYVLYGLNVLVSATAYAIMSFGSTPENRLVHRATTVADGRSRERFLHVASALVVACGLLLFIRGTGLSLAELAVASRFSWFESGEMSGRTMSLGYYLLSFVAVFAYYDIRFGLPRKWLSLLVLCVVLGMVFLAGGRKWLLFIASGAVAGFFDRRGGMLQISGRLVLSLGIIVFLAFAWQFGRSLTWGEGADLGTVADDFGERVPELFAEGDATHFYRASLDAIELNRRQGVLYPFAVVRRLLFLPLPDEWTGGLKPRGIPLLVAERLGADNKTRHGNVPPGLVGLFVLSFGWLWSPLLLAALTLPAVRVLDRLVLCTQGALRDVVFATFPVAAILFMRGSTGGVYFLIANVVLVCLLVLVHAVFSVPLASRRLASEDARQTGGGD